MLLRLVPAFVHDCVSFLPRWQQLLRQMLTSTVLVRPVAEFSMTELSETKRLRGRGLGGCAPQPWPLLAAHSGNWKVASLIGLLGTETVT
jgi:hypothetical protein